jgi:hypothetical protein
MDIRHPPNTLHDNHHVGFVHVHLNVVLEDNTHMQVHACMHNKQDVFFFQFCQVCELAIVHNINEPNLARCQEENYNFFRTFSFFFFIAKLQKFSQEQNHGDNHLDGWFVHIHVHFILRDTQPHQHVHALGMHIWMCQKYNQVA